MKTPKDMSAETFYENVAREAVYLAQACIEYSDALKGTQSDQLDVGKLYNNIEIGLEEMHAIATLAFDL